MRASAGPKKKLTARAKVTRAELPVLDMIAPGEEVEPQARAQWIAPQTYTASSSYDASTLVK